MNACGLLYYARYLMIAIPFISNPQSATRLTPVPGTWQRYVLIHGDVSLLPPGTQVVMGEDGCFRERRPDDTGLVGIVVSSEGASTARVAIIGRAEAAHHM